MAGDIVTDDQLLVGERVVAFLCDEFSDFRILFEKLLFKPRELREHLQVAQGRGIEDVPCAAQIPIRRTPGFVQLLKSRIAPNEMKRVRLEKILQDEQNLGLAEILRGLQRAAQRWIDCFTGGNTRGNSTLNQASYIYQERIVFRPMTPVR